MSRHSAERWVNRPFPNRWYDAAAPEPEAPSTPITGRPAPPCRRDQVLAKARTRSVANGVVGVIALAGVRCSLDITHGALQLRSRSGGVLTVPDVVRRVRVNPGRVVGVDSRAGYGYSWRGSWCGAAPATVVVPLKSGPAAVPLHGPTPQCHQVSSSLINNGVISGYRIFALQTSPPPWQHLTPTLTVSRTTHGLVIRHLVVTLHNSLDRPVALSPRPTYLLGAWDHRGEGTDFLKAPLPLSKRTHVVPADGSVTIRLPNATYPFGLRHAFHDNRVAVSFSIAGAPTASAKTNVR